MEQHQLQVIARIYSEFPEKFGIPRQSGIVPELRAYIVFEAAYRAPEACRGLEDFSHIWLLWGFSAVQGGGWSPTVRPPRLGGNTRMGVFATRSPFRPNPIGLSSVRLEAIETDAKLGMVLHVSGADLMDGSPIYDIKPYLAYTDAHPDAAGGFAGGGAHAHLLRVEIPEALLALLPEEKQEALLGVLAHDPRPSYQDVPDRLYGMAFAGMEVKFTVQGDTLTVHRIEPGAASERP